LWECVGKVMVSHIGKDKMPWLGFSKTGFRNKIGRNALRFYYIMRGYKEVFP